MLDLSVYVYAAKFLHDNLIKNQYLWLETGVDCGRGLRAESNEERAGDAKTFKNDFRVFVLNSLFEELGDLSCRICESGLCLLIKCLGAEEPSQNCK